MKSGQTMEDGAIGILKCIADSNANFGEFYGPGKGRMDMKGPVVKFDLEEFYDNIKDLLWNKRGHEDFII